MGDRQYPGERRHREALYAAFEGEAALDERIDEGLAVGVERLAVPHGFAAVVDDGVQEITHAVGDHALLQPGETCPLSNTYCQRAVEAGTPLAIDHASDSPLVDDAAVAHFGFEAYLGCPIFVDGEVYGTVAFVDEEPRDAPFEELDLLFVELFARLVGNAMEREAHHRTLADRNRELAERNRELTRERDRLSAIANNSFDILFRLDPSGTFTYLSSAVERVLGRAPEAVVGEPFTSVVAEADRDRVTELLDTFGGSEAIEELRIRLVDAAGEQVVVETNAIPIREDGELVAIQGVARDITERAAREEELRVKNRAMDDTQIGITISEMTDDGPELRYVNDGFRRLTGYDAEDIRREGWLVLAGEGSDTAPAKRLFAADEAGEPITEELLSYREDGTPFWHRVRLTPIEDEGRVTHMAGFHEDVTESKREAVLFGVLNRVLRHNLRNEMTILQGLAERIDTAEGAERTALAEDVVEMGEKLTALSYRARELDSFARSERRPERIAPVPLIDRVVEQYAPGSLKTTVDVATDRDLVAGPGIDRALGELVENAAVHDDDPPTSLAIDVGAEDGEVVITLSDDGPGIPVNESAVFQSGRETALEHSGGMGLWLVNWVVTRYGGSFQIRPAGDEERGTVATIRLPAIDDGETVAEASRPPTPLFH